MRSLFSSALALGLALLLAHPGMAGSEEMSASEVSWVTETGAQMPPYSASRLDGSGELELQELEGKVVLLNFWATWCLPCRHEIPVLKALFQEHRDAGFEVLGVSLDVAGAEDRVLALVAADNIPYTILLDPQDRASEIFRFSGLPASFLVSAQGTLVWSRIGPILEDDAELLAALRQALPENGAARASKVR